MFENDLFDEQFDLNSDGEIDEFESILEGASLLHFEDEEAKMLKSSRSYGNSSLDDFEDVRDALSDIGVDLSDLEHMDEDELVVTLEDAGLDIDDYDF